MDKKYLKRLVIMILLALVLQACNSPEDRPDKDLAYEFARTYFSQTEENDWEALESALMGEGDVDALEYFYQDEKWTSILTEEAMEDLAANRLLPNFDLMGREDLEIYPIQVKEIGGTYTVRLSLDKGSLSTSHDIRLVLNEAQDRVSHVDLMDLSGALEDLDKEFEDLS